MEKETTYEKKNPPETFADLGLTFDFKGACSSCLDGSCHNIATSKKDQLEYSVHISTNKEKSLFKVYASEQANTESDTTIDEVFYKEIEAVKFVCESFNGFKCY